MCEEAVREEGTLTMCPPAKGKSKGKRKTVYKSPRFITGGDREEIELGGEELGTERDEDEDGDDAVSSTDEITGAKKPRCLTAAQKGKQKKIDLAPATTPHRVVSLAPPPVLPLNTLTSDTTPLPTPLINTTLGDLGMVVPDSQLDHTTAGDNTMGTTFDDLFDDAADLSPKDIDTRMASPPSSKLTTPFHSPVHLRPVTPLPNTSLPAVKPKKLTKKEASAAKGAKSKITKANNETQKAAKVAKTEKGKAVKADKRVRSPSAASPSLCQIKRAKGSPTHLSDSDEEISEEGELKPAWGARR